MKLQVYRPWIPSVLEVLGLGSDQALSGEEEDKEARIAQMSSPTSAWNPQVAAWRSSTSRSEDMLLPRRQRLRAGLGSGGRGWSTSKPSEIPATVELDELKELYKKKKKDFETWWTQTRSCMSHRVQRSCAHTLHAHLQQKQRILSYIDSPLEPHLHTHQGYINIKSHTLTHTHTHTHTIKHQRS